MIRSFWTTDESPGRRRRRLLATLVISVLALAIAAATPMTASAGTIYSLETPNTALSPYTGPYGEVEVTYLTSTTATITFTASDNGTQFFLFGDGQSIAVNVNATSFTVSGLSASGGNYGGNLSSTPDSGTVNGFGTFNLRLDNKDGATEAFLTATFTLTNTSGTWANEGEVLTANSNDALVAAHIFVFGNSSYTGDALATGYAAGPGEGITEIPEPASATLLAIGLVGMAGYGWRRRRQGGSTPAIV